MARLIEDGYQRASGNSSGKGNDERVRPLDHHSPQLDVVALLADDKEAKSFEDRQDVFAGENPKFHPHTKWLGAWLVIRS